MSTEYRRIMNAADPWLVAWLQCCGMEEPPDDGVKLPPQALACLRHFLRPRRERVWDERRADWGAGPSPAAVKRVARPKAPPKAGTRQGVQWRRLGDAPDPARRMTWREIRERAASDGQSHPGQAA